MAARERVGTLKIHFYGGAIEPVDGANPLLESDSEDVIASIIKRRPLPQGAFIAFHASSIASANDIKRLKRTDNDS